MFHVLKYVCHVLKRACQPCSWRSVNPREGRTAALVFPGVRLASRQPFVATTLSCRTTRSAQHKAMEWYP